MIKRVGKAHMARRSWSRSGWIRIAVLVPVIGTIAVGAAFCTFVGLWMAIEVNPWGNVGFYVILIGIPAVALAVVAVLLILGVRWIAAGFRD